MSRPELLRRMLFVVPNVLTLGSIACGVFAILHTISEGDAQALFYSAIAVFFAGFFDMFDGRVARLTDTQSGFGMEFDSLADIISFGVAPAVIVYRWALWSVGPLGIVCAICFVACGAIRLARFNVLAQRNIGSSDYFMGLPIPIAAIMLVALVIAHFRLFDGMPVTKNIFVLFLVVTLSGLMVSRVSFWTFKNIKFGHKTIVILFTAGIGLFIAGIQFSMSLILAVLISCYIISGITREIYKLLNKKI